MKRIDYFWPRVAVLISSLVFFSQVLVEAFGAMKEGFEWVLAASAIAFALSCASSVFALIWNALSQNVEEHTQNSEMPPTLTAKTPGLVLSPQTPKPVGCWVLYAQSTRHIQFIMYHKPTRLQIWLTELMLGWKWRDSL